MDPVEPGPALKTNLFRYQKQGLAWMLEREAVWILLRFSCCFLAVSLLFLAVVLLLSCCLLLLLLFFCLILPFVFSSFSFSFSLHCLTKMNQIFLNFHFFQCIFHGKPHPGQNWSSLIMGTSTTSGCGRDLRQQTFPGYRI